MVITTKIGKMDLALQHVFPRVQVVQDDQYSRNIEMELYEEGEAWSLPSDANVAVSFKKSDGTGGLYETLPDGSACYTSSGNVLTIALAPQVCTVPGKVQLSVGIRSGKSKLYTFPVCVEVNPNPGLKVVSEDYYKIAGSLADYGWEPGKVLFTNAAGKVVAESLDGIGAVKNSEWPNDEYLYTDENGIVTSRNIKKDPYVSSKGSAIICNAEGSVSSVSDSDNENFRGLTLYGKTTQDGTPTPESPVELESVGASGNIGVTVLGKNLFNPNMIGTCLNDNGKEKTCLYLVAPTDGTYHYILGSKTANLYIGYTNSLDTNATTTGSAAVTGSVVNRTIELKAGQYFVIWTDGDIASIEPTTATLFVGLGADSTYEPYTAQTLTAQTPNGLPGIPVSSGGNYTDESGQQWICDEVDFAKGVYVKRVERVDLGTLQWAVYGSSGAFYAPNYLIDILPSPYAMCKSYPYVNASSISNVTKADYCVGLRNDTGKYYILVKNKDNATDIDAITASLQGVFLYYPLAEENPIALSAEELAQYAKLHTNKPNTTVFNDSGAGMALEYVADTKAYIDQKLAAISAAMLNA